MIESREKLQLRKLLSERNQNPGKIKKIDSAINRKFNRKVCILALDMSGFTRVTAKHGIIQYLSMIERMNNASRPAIKRNGGHVFKQEADNIFAWFRNPEQALAAAMDIFGAFQAMNAVTSDDFDIHGCIGIGFGNNLVIGDQDIFGMEMNAACVLGEDLARRGEILLTPAAHAALRGGKYKFKKMSYKMKGAVIPAWKFQSLDAK